MPIRLVTKEARYIHELSLTLEYSMPVSSPAAPGLTARLVACGATSPSYQSALSLPHLLLLSPTRAPRPAVPFAGAVHRSTPNRPIWAW